MRRYTIESIDADKNRTGTNTGMEKPTGPLAETRLLLAPVKERPLLAPAKEAPNPQLPQETIDRILMLAKQGKSPKKIRAMTKVGIMPIRRLTEKIDFGSALTSEPSAPEVLPAQQKRDKPKRIATKTHYVQRAVKWANENHEQTMDEHKGIDALKSVYFHMFDGKTPKEISEKMRMPQGRVLEILFNPKTQEAVLDASKKAIMEDERFHCFPDDPYEVKRNQALLHIYSGRIRINSDDNYTQLLKEHVPSKLRNFVKLR